MKQEALRFNLLCLPFGMNQKRWRLRTYFPIFGIPHRLRFGGITFFRTGIPSTPFVFSQKANVQSQVSWQKSIISNAKTYVIYRSRAYYLRIIISSPLEIPLCRTENLTPESNTAKAFGQKTNPLIFWLARPPENVLLGAGQSIPREALMQTTATVLWRLMYGYHGLHDLHGW